MLTSLFTARTIPISRNRPSCDVKKSIAILGILMLYKFFLHLHHSQLPRVITISKDSEHRHVLPIDVVGWLCGEYLTKKKVLRRAGRDNSVS